mgnify:CR=1 FL=1
MKTKNQKIDLSKSAILLLIFIIPLFIISFNIKSTAAEQAEISGEYGADLIYENDEHRWREKIFLDLKIEKDLKNNLNIYLNPELKFNSFYKNDEKERELDFKTEEAYINYYTRMIDWRFGRQILSWGSSYNINPTNYLNKIDRESLDPLENREGVDAVKAVYYPSFTYDVEAVISYRDDVDELQQALKITRRRWYGYDFSFSIFNGNSLNQLPMMGNYIYPEVEKAGLDFKGDFSNYEIGLFSELVYSNFKNERLENTTEFVLGMDYKFENNLYLVGQYYFQELPAANLEANKLFMLHADKPFMYFHSWELNLLYDLDNNMSLLRPKIIYSLKRNLDIEIGAVVKLNESRTSNLNRFNEELTYLSITKYF